MEQNNYEIRSLEDDLFNLDLATVMVGSWGPEFYPSQIGGTFFGPSHGPCLCQFMGLTVASPDAVSFLDLGSGVGKRLGGGAA